jgi:hypothetical protein
MASAGLSLVGFMDRDSAIRHLRNDCIFSDPSNDSLVHHWTNAKEKLGPPMPKAGKPEVLDIPAEHNGYLNDLKQTEWVAKILDKLPGYSFKLIEIDPLLAYQVAINQVRADHHCNPLPSPAKIADALPVCLPLKVPDEKIEAIPSGTRNSLLVRTKCLGFQIKRAGQLDHGLCFGIEVNLTPPLLHVVEYKGRLYLHNGFHRALGMKKRGFTHVPCVFRHVDDSVSVGISDGATLPLKVLETQSPPTVGHFTLGKAYDVQLKSYSRVFSVTWNEHLVSNDD